uniref:SCP domain-containing protein n=1 Tax=Angiostrongylus cantonensis TaxID=6313 RepID=A0A0K0D8Z3_ANGCA
LREIRGKHDSPSLIRDATLDSAAQRWANVMGNRRDCLAHESPRRYGENLFFFGARHFPTPTTMAHMVAHSFYVEGMGYDYKRSQMVLSLDHMQQHSTTHFLNHSLLHYPKFACSKPDSIVFYLITLQYLAPTL